jgi:hypothetical protein
LTELPSLEGYCVGDKSPKSKQRDQKQKDAAKVKDKTKKDTTAASASQIPKKK